MFTSILENTSAGLSIKNAVLCIGAAIFLGFLISFVYKLSGEYSKNFLISLIILPALVQAVIMMVNGNLGTSVAVLGAFSLIRFRSVPGSSKEICFIFFAMAAGLASGMGQILFAFVMTVFLCGIFVVFSKIPYGNTKKEKKDLKIVIPEDLDYTGVFDDIFKKYTKSVSLEKVKTINLGSMYELKYSVILKDISLEKEFIDQLRCRNGNLTILCAKAGISNSEL